jgi:hypothetical protein
MDYLASSDHKGQAIMGIRRPPATGKLLAQGVICDNPGFPRRASHGQIGSLAMLRLHRLASGLYPALGHPPMLPKCDKTQALFAAAGLRKKDRRCIAKKLARLIRA